MANVRNYEEYRAEVLETLGATVEDLRNEPSFRAKVLETLGVEFTDEDTRNFERYRLKALEGLKNGGGSGGGGSSDFSTATVTLINETKLGLTLAHIDNTTGIEPEMGQSGEYEVVLYKGKAVGLFTSPNRNLSVTGDISYDDDDGTIFITGDGTITIS